MALRLIPALCRPLILAPVPPDRGGFARHRAAGRDAVFGCCATMRVAGSRRGSRRRAEQAGPVSPWRTTSQTAARGVSGGAGRRRIDFDTRHRHRHAAKARAARTPRIPSGSLHPKPRGESRSGLSARTSAVILGRSRASTREPRARRGSGVPASRDGRGKPGRDACRLTSPGRPGSRPRPASSRRRRRGARGRRRW